MSSPANSPPQIPPTNVAGDDQEFEWLLCVASTFQACQCLQPIDVEEAQRPSRPRLAAAAVRAWVSWPRWRLALRLKR